MLCSDAVLCNDLLQYLYQCSALFLSACGAFVLTLSQLVNLDVCCDRVCAEVSCNCQVDPTLTRADRLVGQVLGDVGQLPDVFTELEINFFLLRRLLGVRTQVSNLAGYTARSLSILPFYAVPCTAARTAYLLALCALCPHAGMPALSAWHRCRRSGNASLSRCGMQGGEKQGKVQKLSKGEVLMLNIGSMCTGARVIAVSCI